MSAWVTEKMAGHCGARLSGVSLSKGLAKGIRSSHALSGDWYRNNSVLESDSAAAKGTRLFLCGQFFCVQYLDRHRGDRIDSAGHGSG